MNGPQDIDAAPAKEFQVEEDPNVLPSLNGLQPVGIIHSPYRNHFATPRQPGTTAEHADGWIILRHGMQNCARDLQGFDRIWVIFWLSYSRGWKPVVKPPRDHQHRGVFATRSPHRPNPIGMSCVRLLNCQGLKLLIRDHDFLHGTPVLDIKPYIPAYDAFPNARAGWLDELHNPGPDHRWI